MINYSALNETVQAQHLRGFFVGWPTPPTPEKHMGILRGSSDVVLAWEHGRVIGFVTAISDGVISAYLPLLEVLPAYQGQGIGGELLRRILANLGPLYMLDVVCDEAVQAFYAKQGWTPWTSAIRRNHEALRR